MTYNLTNLDNTTSIYEFVYELNQITQPTGLYIVAFLYSYMIIAFIGLKSVGVDNAGSMFFASTSTTIIGIALVFANLIGWNMVTIPLVISIISIISLVMYKD